MKLVKYHIMAWREDRVVVNEVIPAMDSQVALDVVIQPDDNGCMPDLVSCCPCIPPRGQGRKRNYYYEKSR